jgi:hypothetical protein
LDPIESPLNNISNTDKYSSVKNDFDTVKTNYNSDTTNTTSNNKSNSYLSSFNNFMGKAYEKSKDIATNVKDKVKDIDFKDVATKVKESGSKTVEVIKDTGSKTVEVLKVTGGIVKEKGQEVIVNKYIYI